MPRTVVLDTNVVFSRVLHESLGRAANTGGLLELIWSEELVAESTRVLVEEKGLDRERAEIWAGLMTDVFPAGRHLERRRRAHGLEVVRANVHGRFHTLGTRRIG